jgi:hypothetical protein
VTISPIKQVHLVPKDDATVAARTYDYMLRVDTNNFEQDFEDFHFDGTAPELSDFYFDPVERRYVHPAYVSVDNDGPRLDRDPDPEVFELLRDENGAETWTRDGSGRLEVTPESMITYHYPLLPAADNGDDGGFAAMPRLDDEGDVVHEFADAAVDDPEVSPIPSYRCAGASQWTSQLQGLSLLSPWTVSVSIGKL